MNTARLFKAAHALRRHNQLHAESKRHWNVVNEILKGSVCYSEWDNSGKPCYALQIPLADYLAMFPDVKPELREYAYDGKQRCYMDYPNRYVGQERGLSLFVSARTDAVTREVVEAKSEAMAS